MSLKIPIQYLWGHVTNTNFIARKVSLQMLLLFQPFRDEKELLSRFPPVYQNKLQEEEEEEVQEVVNINRIKSEPNGDLVDKVFLQFNE